MDPAALSIVAIVISLIALGLTGWQAVTGHLTRTRPKPPMLTLHHVGLEWMLENGGGSTASRISLTFKYVYSEKRGETVTVGVFGDVPAGQRRRIEDRNSNGELFILEGDIERPNGRRERILDKRVRVDWTDYRGRPRVSTVRIA